jgi:23S rRNA (pseudouridine1915-N3)-methyltransferase
MLKITIIQVGKTKDEGLGRLISDLYIRLEPFLKLEEITVKDEESIWKQIPKNTFLIAMEVQGKQYSSEAFAQFIEERKNQGDSHLVFLIGPAEGFTGYQKEPQLQISLSTMTFSHQTVRLLLAEQLYRAISILENKPFPK